MFTVNSIAVTLLAIAFIVLNAISKTESAPTEIEESYPNYYPIAYRRYIRRRPPVYLSEKYVEDIFEIFHTEAKPSSYYGMTDEDVDRFIFCDFNRHLEECKKYWADRRSQMYPVKPNRQPLGTTTSTTTTSSTPLAITTTEYKLPHSVDNGITEEEDYDYEEDNINVIEGYGETDNVIEDNIEEYYV